MTSFPTIWGTHTVVVVTGAVVDVVDGTVVGVVDGTVVGVGWPGDVGVVDGVLGVAGTTGIPWGVVGVTKLPHRCIW
jgi:hypothetical protein